MSQKMQDYIMDICTAYEEGYAVGEHNMSSSFNKYPVDTERFYAWYYGHTNSLTNQMLQDGSMELVLELDKEV